MANGGTALARGTNISEIEGVPPERAVVVEFESVEAAQKAYNSEAYQAAKKKLEGGVDRMLFVIEGNWTSKFRKSHLKFNLEHRDFPLRKNSNSVFRHQVPAPGFWKGSRSIHWLRRRSWMSSRNRKPSWSCFGFNRGYWKTVYGDRLIKLKSAIQPMKKVKSWK